MRRAAAVVVMALAVIGGFGGEAAGELRPSAHYRARSTPFRAHGARSRGAATSPGEVWLHAGGELWAVDRLGEAEAYRLPDELQVERLWPHTAGVTVLLRGGGGRLIANVDRRGETRRLGLVEDAYRDLVPVRGGYVAVRSRGRRRPTLTYVSYAGERRPLPARVSSPPEGDAADTSAPSALPAGGLLARVGPDRVAYVTTEPYEVALFGLDGSVERFEIDAASVVTPRASAFFEGWRHEIDSIRPARRRLEVGGGRLYLGVTYAVHYTLAHEVAGLQAGAAAVGGFTMIDVVDLASGRLLERIDVRGDIDSLTGSARWVGVRDDSLVFIGWRRDEHDALERYVGVASAD